MASSSPKTVYWTGFRDGLPFLLILIPFAMVYGLIAVESGLTSGQAIGFSVVVIAGASQLAALQLMTENAPLLIVLATAVAVNLRMAMYAASLAPHLGAAPLWQKLAIAYVNVDQSFAMSMARYEDQPGMPVPEKVAYLFGVATPVVPMWYSGTWLGTVAGQVVPEDLPIDFAVPVAFLAIVSLMLRTPAHWAAAITSVVLALALRGLPLNTGLLVAAAGAMVVGATVETWAARRS